MPLVPFIDLDEASPETRETFGKLAAPLNIFRMMANAETCFAPTLRLGGAILSKQLLSADLRELVILLAAELEGGEYEWNQHVPIALACGCVQAQIDAVEARRFDDPAFDARTRALLVVAAQVIETVRADEDVVRAAQAHFTPREIVETILTCGFYMTMARLTETTRTDIDPPAGTRVVDALKRQEARA